MDREIAKEIIQDTIKQLKEKLWQRLPHVSNVMKTRIIPKLVRKFDLEKKAILCQMFWDAIKNVQSNDEIVRNMTFMLNALEPPRKNPKFTGKELFDNEILRQYNKLSEED